MNVVTKGVISISTWWKKRSLLTRFFIGALVIIASIMLLKGRSNAEGETVETVKRQNLKRTVVASGKVVSSTDLSLSFEVSKSIESVRVKVGDVVTKGQILAVQKNGSERATYNRARGGLLAAQARYDKVLEGSTNEEVQLAQTNLDITKRTQDALVETARRKLNSDRVFAEASVSSNSTTTPLISGLYTGIEGEYRIRVVSHVQTTGRYEVAKIAYSGLESGTVDTSSVTPKMLGTKGLAMFFPSGTEFQNGESWVITIPNTTSATYVTNKNAYDQAIANRDSAVLQKEAELAVTRATARPAEVDGALADIISAQAQVEEATAQLEKTILRAPADGTITAVAIKAGAVPELNKEAIALQDIGNLYLEANINENAISEISIGQMVRVTYDALTENKNNTATISSIDPAATIADNVVNYKIKALITDTTGIKPGMTANLSIITKEVSQALVLPGRAVTVANGKNTVLLITDARRNATSQKEIEVGIKGDGDLWEIKGGLVESDKVLWKKSK